MRREKQSVAEQRDFGELRLLTRNEGGAALFV